MQAKSYGESNLNFEGGKATKIIELAEITSLMTKSQKEKIFSGCDVKNLAKVFEDPTMMSTVNCFLENGMNVAKTARAMYMHRNTLLYRLNAIRRQTGLDLKDFKMAVTFEILHSLYAIK
ncbi:MAG: helix-turn-helix domain-containing protein [Clostridiales bacterium]|nr:helix-turn-helix domain-containing protein [Clostridiales bacterium]